MCYVTCIDVDGSHGNTLLILIVSFMFNAVI